MPQINAWVGGDAAQAVLLGTTWQWGIGMWAIIYPVCAIPLVFGLWYSQYRAKRSGKLVGLSSPYSQKHFWAAIFWELDVVGLLLVSVTVAFAVGRWLTSAVRGHAHLDPATFHAGWWFRHFVEDGKDHCDARDWRLPRAVLCDLGEEICKIPRHSWQGESASFLSVS